VGGLAEVSHDLPLALAALGHTVDVVTLKCRLLREAEESLERLDLTLEVPIAWQRYNAEVFTLRSGPGVIVYLLSNSYLFGREGLYGNAYGDYEDNAERFIFFSRAAMELSLALGKKVDLIHANDWTTGLVPLYHKAQYREHPLMACAGTLMTVHNISRQGIFWHYDMPLTGLGWEYFTPKAIEFHGKINFLKAGLVFADMISTVSPTFAKEIQTKEMGQGLEGILHARADRLVAVVNGLDYQEWNPASDPYIAANYGPYNLAPKQLCREDLRARFGLTAGQGRPLVGFIGRLIDRRGMDLVSSSLDAICDMGLDLVIMGFGNDHYHTFLQKAQRRRPQCLGVFIGYDMETAHKLIAGCDILLMPSRCEPCGLHQMQALRYGTLPVVRATGGLEDTVSDHSPEHHGVGFKFREYQAQAMLQALKRARDTFLRPQEWVQAMQRAMALNFCWVRAAKAYEKMYLRARRYGQDQGSA
jgi:starch synthase